MLKKSITIISLMLLFATSCEQSSKYNKANDDAMVSRTITAEDGSELNLNFDNENNIVVVDIHGTKEELKRQKTASGFWYANDHYELRGKGNDITLNKDGQTIFEHSDDIQYIESKNENGDVLNMTFNNSDGTVKAYLNGGEQIDLKEKKTASGFWYANDQYELRGKGNDITLNKDGQTIFEHSDDIQYIVSENDKGDVLNMTFNNSDGTVKAYLNGGEQIDLHEQKAASGIWYGKDEYVLSGKGDHYQLKRGTEVLYEN